MGDCDYFRMISLVEIFSYRPAKSRENNRNRRHQGH